MDHYFYFQTLLNTALDGLNNGGITAAIRHASQGILVLTVLYQIYDVWWRDGDYHELGTVLVKAMLMTTLVNTFDPVFRLAVDGFNSVANVIYTHTAGTGDIIQQWLSDVRDHFQVNSLEDIWNLVTGGASAVISMAILAFCNLILPDIYIIFTLAYVIVGVVLYALGQLVLALYPSGALGEYTRSYFKNVVIWGLWPVLYALFADLMTLINMNSVDKVLNAHSFVGGFVNLGSTMLLALASVVFAIAIALIPIIAHHVVSGHIGQAVATVARSLRGALKKRDD